MGDYDTEELSFECEDAGPVGFSAAGSTSKNVNSKSSTASSSARDVGSAIQTNVQRMKGAQTGGLSSLVDRSNIGAQAPSSSAASAASSASAAATPSPEQLAKARKREQIVRDRAFAALRLSPEEANKYRDQFGADADNLIKIPVSITASYTLKQLGEEPEAATSNFDLTYNTQRLVEGNQRVIIAGADLKEYCDADAQCAVLLPALDRTTAQSRKNQDIGAQYHILLSTAGAKAPKPIGMTYKRAQPVDVGKAQKYANVETKEDLEKGLLWSEHLNGWTTPANGDTVAGRVLASHNRNGDASYTNADHHGIQKIGGNIFLIPGEKKEPLMQLIADQIINQPDIGGRSVVLSQFPVTIVAATPTGKFAPPSSNVLTPLIKKEVLEKEFTVALVGHVIALVLPK